MDLDRNQAAESLRVAEHAQRIPTHAPSSQVASVALMGLAFLPAAAGAFWSLSTHQLRWVWLGFLGTLLLIGVGALIGYRARHTRRGFASSTQATVGGNVVLCTVAGALGAAGADPRLLVVVLAAMVLVTAGTVLRFRRTLAG